MSVRVHTKNTVCIALKVVIKIEEKLMLTQELLFARNVHEVIGEEGNGWTFR